MKKNKLVAFTAAGLLLASLGGVKAFAAEGDNYGKDQTNTVVTITDKGDEDKPTTDDLKLVHVPDRFDFTTTLKNQYYKIDSGTVYDGDATKEVRVHSNKVSRVWEVKASVTSLKQEETVIDVAPTLTINTTAVSTGTESTVAKYDGKLTADKYPSGGIHKTLIKDIAIKFADSDGAVKMGELKGEVQYTLYNTYSEAE